VCAEGHPQTYGDRFRVEGDAIEGGMGLVYRAKDLKTGEHVALKVVAEPQGTQSLRFQQEALVLADIAHPAIVRYLAHGSTARGEQYMAMEWLEGETLEDRVARGPLRISETLQLGRRVAEALAVAHKHGVVHRDIKPANVFLPAGDPAQAKVLDFGIARRLFDPHQSLRLTSANAALGTPLYMAPEQARGASNVDGRADIFALGCVLFECLVGRPPFAGESPTAVMAKICLDDSVDVARQRPETPPDLVALIAHMLAKDPAERPASADEIARSLGAIAGQFIGRDTASDLAAVYLARTPTPSLVTTGEQRILAAILVSRPRAAATKPAVQDPGRTADLAGILAERLADPELSEAGLGDLQSAIAPHGARIERLGGGSLVVALTGEQGTPLDQATQAARCALRLKAALPDASLGISTSRADMAGKLSLGDVIDQAGHLLAFTPAGTIHVDPLTAHLLETRFEIEALANGTSRLLFEKGIREAPRTLMGKAVPCFGRDREVDLLEALWDEACDEPAARAMLMTSAAGGGKSRVRHEFCDRIQRHGRPFELLVGRGDPMRDAAPFALLGPALLAAAGITGGEPEPVQRKRLTAHASRFLPPKDVQRIAAFLGEMANLPFPDEDLLPLRAARQDPRLMADQMLLSWLDWLEAECDHHPVLLVLEDLHWGDTPSVNFVDAALRVHNEKPFMVLALARPEVDRRFPGVWKDRNPQRINLAPMSLRASRLMIENVVGKIPEESARWIMDRAQGNPFYLEELLRVVAGGGKVGDDSNLPDTVLGMVQARFDIFGPDAKLVLRAGSIFGQTFRPAGVKALVDEDRRKDVDRWLEILTKREILFSRPAAELREYAFRHALLRQAAYEMLPPAEKRLGHLLAGEYLEQAGERQGIVLADHFERAGEKPRTIRWLGVAAQQALDADDLAETVGRVERGVNLGAAGEELCAMRVIESQARFWRGEYVEAESAAREALVSGDARTRLDAMSALFDALGPQVKYGEIATLFRNLKRPAAPELLNPWLDCMVNATGYLTYAGDNEVRGQTLALLEGSRDRLEPIFLGRAESLRAHIARNKGNPAECLAAAKRAADYYESIGHRRAACEALANVGLSLLEVGRLEEAEACMQQILATARKMDLKYMLGGSLQALTNILAYRGSLAEARAVGEEAIAVNRAQNDRRFQGSAEVYLSVTEYLAGDYARAEQYARAAVTTWETVHSVLPFARALLARALRAQGRDAEALSIARDAYAQFESLGFVEDGEATIRLALAECLLASGDRLAAQEVLAAATKQVHAWAATIEDPAGRQAYLTRIPEHRRILELVQELAASKN
jgi:eukaryotic-like serine/threonine-protein kinase